MEGETDCRQQFKDEMNQAIDNFVSEQDAAWYARLYREKGLIGGHIILLNPKALSTMMQTLLRPWEHMRLFRAV